MPREIEVKTILNKTKARDSWFLDEYTINPYSACSFNCLYCYIRGSKYGEHMESAMAVKTNAVELLDRQLGNRAKKKQYGIIVISSATDPYVKIENDYKLTRQMLEIVNKYRFPVHMITKSDLIIRDIDLLKEIDQRAILPEDLNGRISGSLISFSFSTLDDDVGKVFEPGATPPSKRLMAVKQMKEAGFRTGISMMPLIPFISDTAESLEKLFSAFSDAGVDYLLPATLTLYGNEKADSRTLILGAIKRHYPELLSKYQKWFSDNDKLPAYYRNAFHLKMKELSEKYAIPDTILPEP